MLCLDLTLLRGGRREEVATSRDCQETGKGVTALGDLTVGFLGLCLV